MSTERNMFAQNLVTDKFSFINEDTALTVPQQIIRCFANATTGPIVITLPPVSEARGLVYSFVARTASVTNSVTITHDNDSEAWAGDIVFEGSGEKILLYSDGLSWYGHGAAGNALFTTASSTTAAATTASP